MTSALTLGQASKITSAAFTLGQGFQNHVCCFPLGAKLPKSQLMLSVRRRASKCTSAAFTLGQSFQNHVCCFHFGGGLPKSRLLLLFGGRTSSTSGLTTGKALERFPECSFYPVPSESMVSMHTPQSLCTASASESLLSWQRLGIAT